LRNKAHHKGDNFRILFSIRIPRCGNTAGNCITPGSPRGTYWQRFNDIEAGAVVTKNVPPYEEIYSAKLHRGVPECYS